MKSAIRWTPAAVWMAIIYYLSSQPAFPGGPEIPDKVLHFVAYAVLGALLWWAAAPFGIGAAAAVAVIGAGLYGAADELHQRFIASRSAAVADWIADIAGATSAVVVIGLLRRRGRRGANGPA